MKSLDIDENRFSSELPRDLALNHYPQMNPRLHLGLSCSFIFPCDRFPTDFKAKSAKKTEETYGFHMISRGFHWIS